MLPPHVRLANDIARQFAHLPAEQAAEAVANHMRMFWDPRMLDALLLQAVRTPQALLPAAADAARLLLPTA